MQTAHSTPHNATHSNADPHEIARFAQLANQWWNPQGALHALHAITPLRLQENGRALPPERLTRVQASYDSAGNGRRLGGWKAPDGGPSSASLGGLQHLRNRSRAATRNDPYAFSAIDRLVSNTIGTGITPKPRHPDDGVRRQLQALWEDWCDEADADGRTDLYGLQALVCRAVYESGECFIRLRPRRLADPRRRNPGRPRLDVRRPSVGGERGGRSAH